MHNSLTELIISLRAGDWLILFAGLRNRQNIAKACRYSLSIRPAGYIDSFMLIMAHVYSC